MNSRYQSSKKNSSDKQYPVLDYGNEFCGKFDQYASSVNVSKRMVSKDKNGNSLNRDRGNVQFGKMVESISDWNRKSCEQLDPSILKITTEIKDSIKNLKIMQNRHHKTPIRSSK